MNDMEQEKLNREKAILVGLETRCFSPLEQCTDATMDELEELLHTAGGECVGRIIQQRDTPEPRTYIGEGKLYEIQLMAENTNATLLVFDNELSPSQVRAIEELTKVRVLDRSQLILDIFAQRAQTREGRLQVELAQLKYTLPRLTGMWGHLVRQTASGGRSPIGTRGPGETQLETDRRHIRRKIAKLEEELQEVRRVRKVQRRKREKAAIPVVALIGYTNAGKSTLLNKLTGSELVAMDRLFDTLDPTTRSLTLENGQEILLTDTVGFIRKLPHHLIEAFKATLEELQYANLLLHVVDISNEEWQEQVRVVETLIHELQADETPLIQVFNKSDLLRADILPHGTDMVSISAKSGAGLPALLKLIQSKLDAGISTMKLLLPYEKSGLVDALYREGKVVQSEYQEQGIYLCVLGDQRLRGKYLEYIQEDPNE